MCHTMKEERSDLFGADSKHLDQSQPDIDTTWPLVIPHKVRVWTRVNCSELFQEMPQLNSEDITVWCKCYWTVLRYSDRLVAGDKDSKFLFLSGTCFYSQEIFTYLLSWRRKEGKRSRSFFDSVNFSSQTLKNYVMRKYTIL